MALSANDVQAADVRHARAKLNVCAAPSHVRGDGDGATLAGSSDDLGFLLVVFGIEDRMNDSLALEHPREMLTDLDGNGANEDRPAFAVNILYLVQHGAVLFALSLIDRIVRICARDRPVGGDD